MDVVSEELGADNVPVTCVVSDLVVGLIRISAEVEVLRAGWPALGYERFGDEFSNWLCALALL